MIIQKNRQNHECEIIDMQQNKHFHIHLILCCVTKDNLITNGWNAYLQLEKILLNHVICFKDIPGDEQEFNMQSLVRAWKTKVTSG